MTILGRTGMDVLYGPAVSTETGADHAEQVDYWRIWVSPHSPLSIAIARDDLSLRAVNRGLPVESDKVVLSPPGPDAHRAMATSFLSDVPETARLALQATLESDSDQWWQAWNRELRVFGLSEVWSKFRIGTFHDLLDNALQATGFEQSAVSRISAAIRRRRPTLRSHHQGREVAPETDASEDRDLLLRVVTEALNRLTIAELRELRLPVGAVVDALSQRKHQ